MLLRSIELFGFKSFPERTRIEFVGGVSAILGPNGCGKSNIVDAVKWVLGEQSHKSLRADSMEDVIFNGTENRKPLNWCEVILTLSNEKGILDLDLPEITVGRRLFRNGESEYTINKNPVKLRDVRDLFMDTGVGKSAYSIMEQGRIDQILSNKPEERRYIFEEAAGITRYKSRSQEAERKLELTEENLRQVEGILGEVKRSYDTLKAQASKTEKYRELRSQVFQLEQRIAQHRLHGFLEKETQVQKRLKTLENRRNELKSNLQQLNQDMGEGLAGVEKWENDLKEIQRKIHDLELERSKLHAQASVLQERTVTLENQIQRTQAEMRRSEEMTSNIESQLDEVRREIEKIEKDMLEDQRNITAFQERLKAKLDSIDQYNIEEARLAQQETEIQEAIRQATVRLAALTDDLIRVIDQEVAADPELWNSLNTWLGELNTDLETLYRTVQAKKTMIEDLRRTSDQMDIDQILKQWQEVFEPIEGVVAKFKRLYKTVPNLLGELFSPQGSLWQKRHQDQNLRDLHDQLTQKRQMRAELVETRTSAQEQVRQWEKTLEELKINQARQESFLRTRLDDAKRLESQIEQIKKNVHILNESLRTDLTKREDFEIEKKTLHEKQQKLLQQEDELRAHQEDLRQKIHQQNHSLADKENIQKALFQELNGVQDQVEKLARELGEVQADARSLRENFKERHGIVLESGPSPDEDLEQLRLTLNRLKEEQKSLGQVNLMAPEEFKEVCQRYEFLLQQINDLREAREDLRTVVTEIQKEASRLFLQSFREIQKNFHEIFRRLFGGGRAELRLTDEHNALDAGVELYCQPPGKKLESLSLLSGGEKSLTAVALLFAVYMVRPSPFCILDEIDAALDESNVGRFITMLKEFSAVSQFVVITHNKRTVTGASTLIGVTMEESGVSKVLTIRLGQGQNGREE